MECFFVIGLITSVHCIAMCGGINLSQTLQKETSKDISRKMFQNTLIYNMGRVVSYTIIGSILGAVGGLAGIGDGLQSSFLLQGSMGVNMLGIFQGLRGCLKNHSSKLQKISKMHKIQTSFLHKKISGGRKTPFIIGVCNPWPILEEDKTETDSEIKISYDFLKESSDIFENWKAN